MQIISTTDALFVRSPARNPALSHLRVLEAESIHIFREVAAEFQKPVMLYSIGKDSSVMLRLAQKAFYPGPIPFPMLHVDTGYKFREMIEFRDNAARDLGLDLRVWRNERALADGANPVALGTQRCCGLLKTTALPMVFATEASMRPSAAHGAMKRSRVPKSAFSASATRPGNGTRRTSGPNFGIFTTRASLPGKASASFHSLTGPSSTSGTTSCSKIYLSCRCTSPKSGG
jgi:hypothetical protein